MRWSELTASSGSVGPFAGGTLARAGARWADLGPAPAAVGFWRCWLPAAFSRWVGSAVQAVFEHVEGLAALSEDALGDAVGAASFQRVLVDCPGHRPIDTYQRVGDDPGLYVVRPGVAFISDDLGKVVCGAV